MGVPQSGQRPSFLLNVDQDPADTVRSLALVGRVILEIGCAEIGHLVPRLKGGAPA